MEDFISTLLHYFLEARAEILEKILLVFWSKRWHQKDILKLTDLYSSYTLLKTQEYEKRNAVSKTISSHSFLPSISASVKFSDICTQTSTFSHKLVLNCLSKANLTWKLSMVLAKKINDWLFSGSKTYWLSQ